MKLYIGLGSNLGNRSENLNHAIESIERRIGSLIRRSDFYETWPADMDSEHLFLNAAACFETDLPAFEVLRLTQEIERELGRHRKSVNGVHFDRTIDIDLLQYGTLVVDTDMLKLPHPEMGNRSFVMQPLAEIAPKEQYALPPFKTFSEMEHELLPFVVTEPKTADMSEWEAVVALIEMLSPGKSLSWEDYRHLIGSSENHLALLLHRENGTTRPCGMITLCTTFSPTGRKAWIEDVVIDPAYRGRGLSHRLLEWAKQKAVALGVKKVMLTSRPSRVEANELYRKEGFEPRETNVYQLFL